MCVCVCVEGGAAMVIAFSLQEMLHLTRTLPSYLMQKKLRSTQQDEDIDMMQYQVLRNENSARLKWQTTKNRTFYLEQPRDPCAGGVVEMHQIWKGIGMTPTGLNENSFICLFI